VTLIWVFALVTLIAIALICITNTLTFPRLRRATPAHAPIVSVLIPARNEADLIGQSVSRLLSQNYPHFEVIVLDDESTDGTPEQARQAAAGNSSFRIITGKPLAGGWLGKNWACHQLAEQAKGEILVFTDADVHWEPEALSAVIDLMGKTEADTFTVWPTQETQSWGERLVVPMMMFVIMGYLPEMCVRYVSWPVFAAANGQCMAFRREAYVQIGGHSTVQSNVIEDMGLAWETKRQGLRLVMSTGNKLIRTRMYQGWPEVRDGFAKNILSGHGGRPVFLLLSAAFHWLLFLLPWVWLAIGWAVPLGPAWPWFPLVLVGLAVGVRALSAGATHQRLADAFLLPLSTILMTIIATRSLWWHFRYGGAQWKGRTVVHRA
jgi:chlorobactene glucosyltransferase